MFTRAGELIGIISHNITKSGGSEGLGFVVTSDTVRSLLVEPNRGFFGVELMLLSGPMAEALNVPQAGGFKGGDRIGIVDGQQIVIGGDILLAVQGITTATVEEVVKALEGLRAGQDLRVTILRGDKTTELSMTFTGF